MVPYGVKIAFFGSDKFSISSLRSLLRLRAEIPGLIGSVDVITRHLKPKGRKLKILHDLPVGEFAANENVNVLRADSKRQILDVLGYKKFDLCVAVSYGNLIPREFIESTTFGGVNVHPSLLPKYSGSSPIQYALMNDDKYTGVTVQTLHPTKFDRGEILLQSSEMEIEDSDNYGTLEKKLGEEGGRLLVEVMKNGWYVDKPVVEAKTEYSSAFKIDSGMCQVTWDMTSRQIKRRFDALGSVYSYLAYGGDREKGKRVIFNSVQQRDEKDEKEMDDLIEVGSFKLIDNVLVIKTIDGLINVKSLTFECCSQEDASVFYKRLQKRTKRSPFVFFNK